MTKLEKIEEKIRQELSQEMAYGSDYADDVPYLLERLNEAEMAILDVNLYYGDGRNIIKNYFSKWEPKE